ncbi:MAG: sodium:calcium antiporter [Pseudomonadota bacterium]|jgi:cation:H+ antiporter
MIPEQLAVWLQFFACTAVITHAGSRLSKYGDVIADKTGLGGSLVGLVLLATVTSLPELITGISAVALAKAPDIAVGNVLGACVMNLAMIVVLDFLHRSESVYSRASRGHILSAAFGAMLLGFVALNLLVAGRGVVLAVGPVGLYSPLLILFYGVALKVVYTYERREAAAYVEQSADRYPHITLRQAALRYGVAAAAVVGAALWLPFIAESLARTMGWNQSFVGTLLVSVATTLPEMTVTVSALRLGALDMAVGNLFGSNLFNLALLALQDLFYLDGPLFSHVSAAHAMSALSAVIMTGLAIAGLFYRPKERVLGAVGWVSLLLAWIYVSNAYLLYRYGS